MDASPSKRSTRALRSEFADDPDMRELVEFFISDLGQRIDAIRSAYTAFDRARLRTLAHQLKGAAGGYGFPAIGVAAASHEQELGREQASLAALSDKVEDLIQLCSAALPERTT